MTPTPIARLAHVLSAAPLRASLKERRISRRTRGSPDRVALVRDLFPPFTQAGGDILWVGCRRYTDDYPARLEAQGGRCWTMDFDPAAAPFGNGSRHRTGDLLEVERLFPQVRFDAILCSGVFGYGVDTAEAQATAAQAMARAARPGAHLLLGWNTDKLDDPVAAGRMAPWTAEARLEIAGTTHVYDLLHLPRA